MFSVRTPMTSLLVLTPAPTPYRDPFWAEVARQPGLELLVCYLMRESRDRPWRVTWQRDFPYRELPGRNLLAWRGPTEACYWNPAVRQLVSPAECHALVLGGYNHLTLLVAMLRARRHGIPFFLMSESHLKNPRAAWKNAAKRPLLRWIVRHSAGLLPTGTLAADYFRHYGASDDKMAHLPNVPDIAGLMRRTEAGLPRREGLRRELGLGPQKVILFAGRLIPKKGVHTLIEASARLPRNCPWSLTIVGEGTYRPYLQELAAKLGVAERVRFVGFVQPERLPDWYRAADVFVLPSSETWGVVVLEAQACGLPVIVSDQTGCWPDALPPGDAARCIFPFGDAAALAQRLESALAESLDHAARLVVHADHLHRFTYTALAERFVRFVTARLGRQAVVTSSQSVVPVA